MFSELADGAHIRRPGFRCGDRPLSWTALDHALTAVGVMAMPPDVKG